MAKGKTMQAIVSLAGSIDPSLGKAIDSATDQISKLNLKSVAIGAAVGGIAIATGKAVAEAGKYLLDLGKSFDDAADSIRIGTGATGDALDALLYDFDEVYKSVPTTMEDASKAIAEYNTRLDLTGTALQEISVQAIQVADMLDEDLGSVIENSSKAFQQWNIDADDMSGAMDYVFKISQSTGAGFTDLLDRVQKFGPELQDMGYSFETATALIGQMEKSGVDTDAALGAMKKSIAKLAKEGINASDGFALYYEAIKNAEDATAAASIASELFGSSAGPAMAAAIRDGTLAVGEFAAELMASGETINGVAEDTYNFEDRLQIFKQTAEVALKPMANTLLDSLDKLLPSVTKAMEALSPAIAEVTEVVAPLIEDLFDGLAPVLESLLPTIVELGTSFLEKLIPPIMTIINALLPAAMNLLDALSPLLDTAISLLGPILALIADMLAPLLDLITTGIGPLIEKVAELISTALEPLGPIIESVSGLFTGVLGGAIEAVQPVIENLIGIFSGLIDFITNVFSGNWEGAWEGVKTIFSNIIGGLEAIFKAPINFIINGINTFLGGLNKIKIPDWVPGVGGKGINIPLIPTLGTGGFTEGISIAGEAGTEAVISFDPAVRSQNLAYWAQAGQMLGATDDSSSSILSSGSGSSVVYDLSGLTFAPQFNVERDIDEDELIRKLRALEPEFVDFIFEALSRREGGTYVTADSRLY